MVAGLEPARVAEIPNRKGQNYILSIVTNLSVYQFRHTTVFAPHILTDGGDNHSNPNLIP